MMKIVATTSLPVDRLTATNCNADARANTQGNSVTVDEKITHIVEMHVVYKRNPKSGVVMTPCLTETSFQLKSLGWAPALH